MGDVAHEVEERTTDDGRVLWLRFRTEHPVNVMTRGLLADLSKVVERLRRTPGDVRVLVFQGTPRIFSGGADVEELLALEGDDRLAMMVEEHELFRAVETLPMIVITSIAGACAGMGTHLALASDFRIADERARIGLPETKVGIAATAQRVSRYVGIGRAKDFLLSGRLVPAQEALEWGLLTYVVPVDDLEERTRELASSCARMAPLAIGSAKLGIDQAYAWNDAQHRDELQRALASLETEDFREGITSVVEKRDPRFVGR